MTKFENIIFTFWEPQGELPQYLEMCLETWKKYLSEYKIVILNYSNLDTWLGKNFYDKYLYENFSLAEQSYAIRAAVLLKHGGIWLDIDTIITSENANLILKSCNETEFALIDKMTRLIVAKKKAKILKTWVKGIKHNIWKHKYFFKIYFKYFPYKVKDMMSWKYFTEYILRHSLKTKDKKKFKSLKNKEINALPEQNWNSSQSINRFVNEPTNLFSYFYMNNNFVDFVFEKNCGIVCLHNSWISNKYKNFSREEILKQNNTISEIFRQVL